MNYNHEINEQINEMNSGEQVNVVYTKTKKDKKPPYIVVGNGGTTKKFTKDDVVDAFRVFSRLSKTQQNLFIMLKDILIQQNMEAHYKRKKAQNPNQIILQKCKENEEHQLIKKLMSQNKNGTKLTEEGVLKQKRPGMYMLNPFLFLPSNGFKEIEEIWHKY